MSLETKKINENGLQSHELTNNTKPIINSSQKNVDENGPIDYRMRPSLDDIFKAKTIKEIIQRVLTKTLQGFYKS